MEPFEIRWRKSTAKDLKKIPAVQVLRIIEAVEALAVDPFLPGPEKLTGSERTYRLRIGDYRVIYEVFTENRVVEIERVRHRKDAYRP